MALTPPPWERGVTRCCALLQGALRAVGAPSYADLLGEVAALTSPGGRPYPPLHWGEGILPRALLLLVGLGAFGTPGG